MEATQAFQTERLEGTGGVGGIEGGHEVGRAESKMGSVSEELSRHSGNMTRFAILERLL